MRIDTLEPAYHPNHKLGFLIDWLLTLKCNYDCAYCPIGPTGHDNSTNHPSLENCLLMLEQMYQYTDVVMSHKKDAFKEATLNIYGGESVYHPNIIDIMKKTSELHDPYKNKWRLRRRITTNGTSTHQNWKDICEHVEGFTMSYHSTGPEKLKKMFRSNLLYLMEIKKEHDVIVCMYPDKNHWQDCVDFLHWSRAKGMRVRAKMLDGPLGMYTKHQLADIKDFIDPDEISEWNEKKIAHNQSRGCCGGRKMCFNRDLKNSKFMVPRTDNGFQGWHCSANQFFLHGNNVTGLYYTNKDCRVKLGGETGPIANIDNMSEHIQQMKERKSMPTLICAQADCGCGTCAPKSVQKENLTEILKIYNQNQSAGNEQAR